MRVLNKSLDELLAWGLKLGFVLFIFCIIVPAFLLHAFNTLKDIPTEPWPIVASAFAGGIVGAALRDCVKMVRAKHAKAKLRNDPEEEVE